MTKDRQERDNDRLAVFPKGAEKSTCMSNFPLVTDGDGAESLLHENLEDDCGCSVGV